MAVYKTLQWHPPLSVTFSMGPSVAESVRRKPFFALPWIVDWSNWPRCSPLRLQASSRFLFLSSLNSGRSSRIFLLTRTLGTRRGYDSLSELPLLPAGSYHPVRIWGSVVTQRALTTLGCSGNRCLRSALIDTYDATELAGERRARAMLGLIYFRRRPHPSRRTCELNLCRRDFKL